MIRDDDRELLKSTFALALAHCPDAAIVAALETHIAACHRARDRILAGSGFLREHTLQHHPEWMASGEADD